MRDLFNKPRQHLSAPSSSAHRAGVTYTDMKEIEKAGYFLSNRNIYIVEDDPSVSNALVRFLEIRGLEVAVFDTAEAFLGELHKLPSGSLIVDMQLPGLTGLQLLDEMARSGIHWPAVVMSGAHEGHEDAVSSALGPGSYLRKPFDADALLRMLHSASLKL